ncbi:bifunctional riboflavin kinase/FAD synthetase [Donghicola sp.]|jgi:riboflavin kinase/FMN adenylyltransferase|uniref:bifunctional riboflavin kinase/FAD synthetase n=1 Tax=Donghicola sp. TaxID=1929294 RepID=UPI0025DE4E86|nr:bifunctional riboflavin kinase/FAD synthetase [Donghicola sp.]MCT4577867.1 bifunctional riboflavin kinase/FAD synthetase [Donghicola sp.]
MRIIRDHQYIAPENKGASVAIGNFDGVHLGHQAVIDLARAGAQRLNAPLGVMTFEPHPRQFFAPDAAPFRLMSAEARAARLEKLGVEVLYELPFNGPLAGLTAEAFARDVIKGLGLCHVVVGNDFQFGKGRSGTAADLARMGAEMGFDVTIADMIQGSQGRVSSTAIRQALTDGDPRHAAEMLGHWHRIDGPVISGEQRGRDLGYPTANMSVDGLHLPKLGVYAVLVEVKEGPHKGNYHGVASLGVRPMFGENTPNLETFIFDFKGDLYGTHLSVGLVDYLRPEMKFDGLDALITQMDADSAKAREILAAL